MRAILVRKYGDADQLVMEEVALPEPKAGQVRLRVEAAGVNFVEIYQRMGAYPMNMPYTPGAEFSGIVDAVGAGVEGFKAGDRVTTTAGIGGYAEYALVPEEKLVHVPDAVSLEQAAAIMLQGITAHYLAYSTFPLKPGHTALIHAAAGGVGQLLVQIAKKCGAQVIGTVSTPEKAQLARQAGADHVILYTQEDFEVEVKRITGNQGLEVVYDGVGKTTFDKGLKCLKPRGYMVLFGQSSGGVEPVNPRTLQLSGSLFLTRPTMGHYMLTREELLWRVGDLFGWIASGELKVRIDRVFPLAEASKAHTYLEDRKTKGKVLLKP